MKKTTEPAVKPEGVDLKHCAKLIARRIDLCQKRDEAEAVFAKLHDELGALDSEIMRDIAPGEYVTSGGDVLTVPSPGGPCVHFRRAQFVPEPSKS